MAANSAIPQNQVGLCLEGTVAHDGCEEDGMVHEVADERHIDDHVEREPALDMRLKYMFRWVFRNVFRRVAMTSNASQL